MTLNYINILVKTIPVENTNSESILPDLKNSESIVVDLHKIETTTLPTTTTTIINEDESLIAGDKEIFEISNTTTKITTENINGGKGPHINGGSDGFEKQQQGIYKFLMVYFFILNI